MGFALSSACDAQNIRRIGPKSSKTGTGLKTMEKMYMLLVLNASLALDDLAMEFLLLSSSGYFILLFNLRKCTQKYFQCSTLISLMCPLIVRGTMTEKNSSER